MNILNYKRMNKIIGLLCWVMLGWCLPVYAEEVININLKDGRVIAYALKDSPVMSHENDALIVETSLVRLEYPLADMSKITFGTLTSIRRTEISGWNMDDGEISVANLSGNESVSIYDAQGKLLRRQVADKGHVSMKLDRLPQGVYIIKIGSQSHKIIKK